MFSLWRHFKQYGSSEFHWIGANYTFDQAIEKKLLSEKRHSGTIVYWISMAAMLCGPLDAKGCHGESRLAIAKENLVKHFEVVGILEYFPQTIALLSACLGMPNPKPAKRCPTKPFLKRRSQLDRTPHASDNAAPALTTGYIHRLLPDTYTAAVSQQREDMALYEFGLRIFTKQLMTTQGLGVSSAAPFLR